MDKILKIILIILTLCIITGVCFRKKENFAKNKISKKKCKNLGRKFKNGKCTNKCLNKKFKFNRWKKNCIRRKKTKKKTKKSKGGNNLKEIKKCLTKHLKGVGCTSIPTRAIELNIEKKCKIPNNPKMKKQVHNHVRKICNKNKPIPNHKFKQLVYDYFVGDRDIVIDKTNPIPMIEYTKLIFDENTIHKVGDIEIGYQHREYQEYYDKAISNIKQKMPDYTNKLTKKIIKEYGRIEEWNVSLVTDMSKSFSDLPANCLGQLWWNNYFTDQVGIQGKKVMTHPLFNIDKYHPENTDLSMNVQYEDHFPTLKKASKDEHRSRGTIDSKVFEGKNHFLLLSVGVWPISGDIERDQWASSNNLVWKKQSNGRRTGFGKQFVCDRTFFFPVWMPNAPHHLFTAHH